MGNGTSDVIDCVEIHEYSFEVQHMAPAVDTTDYHDSYFTFEKGAKAEVPRFVVVVKTRGGGRGEYAPSLLAGLRRRLLRPARQRRW